LISLDCVFLLGYISNFHWKFKWVIGRKIWIFAWKRKAWSSALLWKDYDTYHFQEKWKHCFYI